MCVSRITSLAQQTASRTGDAQWAECEKNSNKLQNRQVPSQMRTHGIHQYEIASIGSNILKVAP